MSDIINWLFDRNTREWFRLTSAGVWPGRCQVQPLRIIATMHKTATARSRIAKPLPCSFLSPTAVTLFIISPFPEPPNRCVAGPTNRTASSQKPYVEGRKTPTLNEL
jgi:hypothetical protein